MTQIEQSDSTAGWTHANHDAFVAYYKDASSTPEAVRRSQRICELVSAVHQLHNPNIRGPLQVADIGCGPGAQSLVWATAGHEVHGIDVSAQLVDVARERVQRAGFPSCEFSVASATELPWENDTMDVCILPELLEHVELWRECLDEGARILRPGGVMFLSTTNKLCPKQQEFSLPGYSWYPAPVKRWVVALSRTRYPRLAGYATYPAVNWFTPYQLKRELDRRGFESFDRFDLLGVTSSDPKKQRISRTFRRFEGLKWIGHVLTPYSRLIAVKRARRTE